LAESEIARRLKKEERKNKFKERIVQAGLYGRKAATVFLTFRIVALATPIGIGLALGWTGYVTMVYGVTVGAIVGLAGTLAPSFWLDYVKRNRQKKIRRALPDALDVITVCLEAGMSLSGALARVARELATAHPMLALELAIVQRETQMGRTTGEAMRAFANRFDLEELRSLASVITQAERFGSSVTRAMEVYSETLRLKRHQHAEEMAQKAVVKMIFPTLLCIFPGIFIVILGPAAIRIYNVLISGALARN
jgi:tight adherence protein C